MNENKDAQKKKSDKLTHGSDEIFGSIKSIVEKIKRGESNLNDVLDKIESSILIEVIQQANNNNTQASKILGINRTTFIMKLRKLRNMGIEPNLYKIENDLL